MASTHVRVWMAALGAALLLMLVYFTAPSPAVAETAWVLLVSGACAGVLLGLRHYRPLAAGPWYVLAAGMGLFTAGNVLNHPLWSSPDRAVALQLLELVAFSLLGVAALGMVRRQRPQGDHEGAIDGAIVMIAIATVLVGTVFEPQTLQTTSLLGTVLRVVPPLLLAAVTAAAVRLLFVGARVPSIRLLAGASLCALVGQVARIFAQTAGTYERGDWQDVFIGLAYAGVGLAALHPSMRRLTLPGLPAAHRITHVRMAILGASLVTPPLILLITDEQRMLSLVASLGVALLVLVRLWQLVTAHDDVRDEMRRRAVHDALTGLPNRLHLLDHLDGVLHGPGTGPATAVLFVDLDGFKKINDDFGHRIGDETLIAVADRLRDVVRDGDLLGRLSGDEFVLICPDVGDDDITQIGARVLGAFERPFQLSIVDVQLGASIGIATCTAPGPGVEQLINEADAAMYAAKQRGGGSVEIYGEGLGARLARRRSIEFDLPDAVRDDALRLVYQPVLTLTPTGAPRVVGVEALLRWTHPRLGDITPIELIPLADATGHIVELGGWVLQESCRQLARWRDAGELPDGFRMFVNLSPRQLLHARLPEQVAATLAGLGLRGDQLVLEVTETAAMDDTGMALRTLEALRVQGIAIALDDFGTGYSSLTHLKRLPLDLIKIDATFVQDLCRSGDDRAIVTAIVSIARQLGAQVVGEGVESRDQEATLRRLGCDLVQGFHVGRPAPAAQLDLRGVGAPSSFV